MSKLKTPMKDSPQPEYLIPFISDFGFKRAFADEKDTVFARKAIQVLASLKVPLKELTYTRNEKAGLTKFSRKGVIEVFCEDENQQVYITEMQHIVYPNMFERLMYYLLLAYDKMVLRGKRAFSKVKPVICICISSESMLDGDRYYTKISLKNEQNQTVFDKIQFYIIELSKFTKPYEECISDLDKLLFTMKNGHKINIKDHSEIPPFWGEEWMDNVIEKLKDSNLTPNERMNYKVDLAQVAIERERYHDEMKKKRKAKRKMDKLEGKVKDLEGKAKEAEDKVKQAERQAKQAEQQAKQAERQAKQAERQAKEKTMTDTTAAALKNGMTVDQITSILNYPKRFVLKIKEQLDREN